METFRYEEACGSDGDDEEVEVKPSEQPSGGVSAWDTELRVPRQLDTNVNTVWKVAGAGCAIYIITIWWLRG